MSRCCVCTQAPDSSRRDLYLRETPLPLVGEDMFTEEEMALANVRFLARGGQAPEFYDLLCDRVLERATRWPTLDLSGDENLVLAASKARLLCELAYLRSLSLLGRRG